MDTIEKNTNEKLSLQRVGAGALIAGAALYAASSKAAVPGKNSSDTHHTLNRVTMGVTAELLAYVDSIGGIENYIEEQLVPLSIDDSETDGLINQFSRMKKTSEALVAERKKSKVKNELNGATVVRAVNSRRQLQEVMVDFWSNHFNVDANKGRAGFYKVYEDRVLRRRALGSFIDLLSASARSPAMLTYLDNETSRADKGRVPNENYARELMELHTVGVDGGYDEQDVIEAAYVFSGWSIGTVNNRKLVFKFKQARNRLGPLENGGDILGWKPIEGSRSERNGNSLLRHLARHPSTAKFICWKLCRYFVSDAIPMDDPLVVQASQIYLANDTEVAPVLRVIFLSSRFIDSKGEKVKRPNEYLYAMLRGASATLDVSDAEDFGRHCRRTLKFQQHALFECEPPTGYSNIASRFINTGTLLSRWNLAFALIANKVSNTIHIDPASWDLGQPVDIRQLVNRLSIQLMGKKLQLPERDVLYAYLSKSYDSPVTVQDFDQLPALAALVFASASFQVR